MIKGFIISLSGDDYTIIRKASKRTQLRFLLIGVLVGLVTLSNIVSWYIILSNLIKAAFFVFLLAVFISWMTTNIYLLTLYTLTKQVLPCEIKNKKTTLTVLGKYLFLIMLGLVVSTPYSVMIYRHSIDDQIAYYRDQKIKEYVELSNQYMQSDSLIIVEIVKNRSNLGSNSFFQNYLTTLRKEKKSSEIQMTNLVNRSPFYLHSIILLYVNFQGHWLFTIPFIVIFISPAILKQYLPKSSEYYRLKREIETRIIDYEYTAFKVKYSNLISAFSENTLEWREMYEDPPYNTIKKSEVKPYLLGQDILLSELYNG